MLFLPRFSKSLQAHILDSRDLILFPSPPPTPLYQICTCTLRAHTHTCWGLRAGLQTNEWQAVQAEPSWGEGSGEEKPPPGATLAAFAVVFLTTWNTSLLNNEFLTGSTGALLEQVWIGASSNIQRGTQPYMPSTLGRVHAHAHTGWQIVYAVQNQQTALFYAS